MMKNWGVIGGIAAAMAAGVYVLWGPISDRKKKRKGLFTLWLKVLEEVKVSMKSKLTILMEYFCLLQMIIFFN